MKTKSRKRLLISSVAMLLVAMLALGTATFAWFTQDSTVIAREFGARTVKTSELKLSSKTKGWTENLVYNYDEVLKPVSTVDGKTWFTAVAAGKDNSAASVTTAKELTGTEIPAYAIVDQLNIKNFGGAAVDNVTINFTLKELDAEDFDAANRYLRIALVKVDSQGDTSGDYATKFAKSVYAVGDDTAPAIESLVTEENSTTGEVIVKEIKTKDITATASKNGNISIPVGPLDALNEDDPSGSTAYYNLYAWFEGQDDDCKDANAGNKMPKITFTVTGDTVNQQAGK